MVHAEHRKEGEGATVSEVSDYAGQWFDDMGALALAFGNAPSAGIDIARSGVSRAQANDMAKNLINSGISPYDDDEMPVA